MSKRWHSAPERAVTQHPEERTRSGLEDFRLPERRRGAAALGIRAVAHGALPGEEFRAGLTRAFLTLERIRLGGRLCRGMLKRASGGNNSRDQHSE